MKPLINRLSLFTSEFEGDAILTTWDGAVIFNHGDIVTTGAQGDGIFGSGSDVQIANWGDIDAWGDGASAIWTQGAGTIIRNFGNVATHGEPSAGGIPVAIGVVGDSFLIENRGTVSTDGLHGWGLAGVGNYGVISNYGSIATAGEVGHGIYIRGSNSLILNRGEIEVVGSGSSGLMLHGYDSTVINYGDIVVTGRGGDGIRILGDGNSGENAGDIYLIDGAIMDGAQIIGDGNVFTNSGNIFSQAWFAQGLINAGSYGHIINSGSISLSGPYSVGVWLIGAEGGFFENSGQITVSDSSKGIWITGQYIVVNTGVISATGLETTAISSGILRWNDGDLILLQFDDTIVNSGLIVGGVHLSLGDDVYVAATGGRLQGTLQLGEGNDLVVVETKSGVTTIQDFATGLGSDDTLDFSAFSFSSFSQIMSAGTQVGNDVLFELDHKTSVILQNVALDELSTDDFVFAEAPFALDIFNFNANDSYFI